jgi:hypothetical protein
VSSQLAQGTDLVATHQLAVADNIRDQDRRRSDVTGYYIHARDGDIGHVEDFLISTPGLGHPLSDRRYEELVARQACNRRAAMGLGHQLVGRKPRSYLRNPRFSEP